MVTGNIPIPTIHVYKEINEGKYKGVKHYEIVEVKNGTQKLSDLLNIQIDRGFAKVSPTFWLKVRSGKKWQNLTGLFYTAINGVFIADKGKKNTKQDLIIVQFAKDNSRTLIVYYFNKYYTNDLKKVIQFINQ
jgi:hypothetical protein